MDKEILKLIKWTESKHLFYSHKQGIQKHEIKSRKQIAKVLMRISNKSLELVTESVNECVCKWQPVGQWDVVSL